MENQTGYDLNAAIESWRQELAAQAGLTADERRELETHLRDAIAGFQQRGLNEEESFWLARKRVGQPREIGEEYAKTDPAKVWHERVFWMVLALFLMGTAGTLPSTISMFIYNSGSLGHTVGPLLLYSIPVILAVFLALGKMTGPFSRLADLFSGRFRTAAVACILILGSSALRYLGVVTWYAHINADNARIGIHLPPFQYQFSLVREFEGILPLLIMALLLIWLLPKRNRKQLQGA